MVAGRAGPACLPREADRGEAKCVCGFAPSTPGPGRVCGGTGASHASPEGRFRARLSAASMMVIAPIVVFGWFSQNQPLRGIAFGAMK